MTRADEINQRIWDLNFWFAAHRVPFALGKRSDGIMDNWEKRGINPDAVAKYREWKLLQAEEAMLEEVEQ